MRLGRSLRHLVALVGELVRRDVGLLSLNDPVDTTSAQGRLVFNLFASLAEFEREVIAERTKAGLSAARARGRRGGRPAGLSSQAEATAMVAQTLYLERRLSVTAIARKLHISKSTLYRYLRHRGVQVSLHKKAIAAQASGSAQADMSEGLPEAVSVKKATVLLWLRVENNNKHVRGKKRALENIKRYCLPPYEALRRASGEYALQVPYCSDAALDQIVCDLLEDIAREADMCNCFSESNAQLEGTERCW
jgi:transposase-like protein